MDQNEEQYKKELAESGVELPELEATETPEQKAQVEAQAKADADAKDAQDAEDAKATEKATTAVTEPLTTEPKEERKPRSIYDEYKDKKSELKTEKELREQVEKERDELKVKLEAVGAAKTPEEKKIATDDLDEFAKEIDADPQALRRMRDEFLKGVKTEGLSEEDRKIIEDAKAITASHSKELEKQTFENEYQAVVPSLKELLPNATDEEMQAVKKEIDRVSHTKEFADKDLDYVVFKTQKTLSELVSPKKRGLEGKGNKDVVEENNDFNPNADYSKMTPTERDKWEEQYKNLGKSEGLQTDAQGRKLLI